MSFFYFYFIYLCFSSFYLFWEIYFLVLVVWFSEHILIILLFQLSVRQKTLSGYWYLQWRSTKTCTFFHFLHAFLQKRSYTCKYINGKNIFKAWGLYTFITCVCIFILKLELLNFFFSSWKFSLDVIYLTISFLFYIIVLAFLRKFSLDVVYSTIFFFFLHGTFCSSSTKLKFLIYNW